MFIIGHIAYPALFFIIIAKLFHIEYSFSHLLILMFSAAYPDLDYIFNWIVRKGKFDFNAEHRKWFTHWPVTYLPLLVLLYFHPSLTLFLICLGIYSHFVLDTFFAGNGLMWFYPLKKKYYNLLSGKTKGYYGKEWFNLYKKMFIYKVDLLSFVVLLVMLIF